MNNRCKAGLTRTVDAPFSGLHQKLGYNASRGRISPEVRRRPVSPRKQKTRHEQRALVSFYAAFLTLAHLARCAAAIFLRATIDKVRFGVVFLADAGCGPFPTFAHRALWA